MFTFSLGGSLEEANLAYSFVADPSLQHTLVFDQGGCIHVAYARRYLILAKPSSMGKINKG